MLDENLQIKSLRFRLKCDSLFDIYYKSVIFFLIWFSIFVFVNSKNTMLKSQFEWLLILII